MIGATAYVMAPICFQALMDLNHFGSACILGDWNKVTADILNDGFGSLKITGKTTEGLDLVIYYDIAHKRIKSHYPDSEKF